MEAADKAAHSLAEEVLREQGKCTIRSRFTEGGFCKHEVIQAGIVKPIAWFEVVEGGMGEKEPFDPWWDGEKGNFEWVVRSGRARV